MQEYVILSKFRWNFVCSTKSQRIQKNWRRKSCDYSIGENLAATRILVFHFPFVYWPHSGVLLKGQSDAVAIKPWRRVFVRDLCSSSLQHGTIVPEFNGFGLASDVPINVPIIIQKMERQEFRIISIRLFIQFYRFSDYYVLI